MSRCDTIPYRRLYSSLVQDDFVENQDTEVTGGPRSKYDGWKTMTRWLLAPVRDHETQQTIRSLQGYMGFPDYEEDNRCPMIERMKVFPHEADGNCPVPCTRVTRGTRLKGGSRRHVSSVEVAGCTAHGPPFPTAPVPWAWGSASGWRNREDGAPRSSMLPTAQPTHFQRLDLEVAECCFRAVSNDTDCSRFDPSTPSFVFFVWIGDA